LNGLHDSEMTLESVVVCECCDCCEDEVNKEEVAVAVDVVVLVVAEKRSKSLLCFLP
jgi:hypothetical protein